MCLDRGGRSKSMIYKRPNCNVHPRVNNALAEMSMKVLYFQARFEQKTFLGKGRRHRVCAKTATVHIGPNASCTRGATTNLPAESIAPTQTVEKGAEREHWRVLIRRPASQSV